jgi:hypothetical protein
MAGIVIARAAALLTREIIGLPSGTKTAVARSCAEMGFARGLLMQGTWPLPQLLCTAHVQHGGAHGGPRPARGSGSAVGPIAAF